MDTKNTSRQLRYLEEVRIPLHRAGFETLPLEGAQLPVLWNGAPLCRITGKGSVFYRRENADMPQAEDALYRVEDIAAKTLEYMTAMEAAPQLKASGLDGDYRILADFGGTVLAGTPSKYGVQFVTWDWDYDRTGVVHALGAAFFNRQKGKGRLGIPPRTNAFERHDRSALKENGELLPKRADEAFFGRDADLLERMGRGDLLQQKVLAPYLLHRYRCAVGMDGGGLL